MDAGLECAREALGTDVEVPVTSSSRSRGAFLFQGQLSDTEPERPRGIPLELEAEYGAFVENLLTNADPGSFKHFVSGRET